MLSKKLTHLLKQNWLKVFSVTFLLLFFGSYANIFAIASPYTPGETLDPTCLPGEVNCTVLLPSGGSSPWIESGNNIYFDTGNVGVGTDNPTKTITIRGGSLFLEGRVIEDPEPSLSSVFAEDEMFPFLQNPALVVDNDYAYIGTGTSLFVLDVSSKNNPSPVDYLENIFPQSVSDMAISGNYLFVVDGSPTSLYALDISNPYNISVADSISDSLLFPTSLD
ncbi:MAG: hypothetical protein PHT84_02875, partial [Candidatus Pacebacteria bacterium]|nr:hypothetical protein [Candidatus Paceibacterota bacterium]